MWRRLIMVAVLGGLLVGSTAGPAAATPVPVDISGDNAVVRTTEPGLSCAEGGEGSYRHVFADGRIAGGVLSKLPGTARVTLDVHYDGTDAASRPKPNAFVSDSHVVLANERGSVTVALRGGSCAMPGVAYDGDSVSVEGGTWAAGDLQGDGAYREANGSGTFGYTAELHPGADNHWALKLTGAITVLQPGLAAKVERTYWGNLGLDYLTRIVTVDYRIGNTGRGDSFGARFTKVTPAGGVKACGEPPGLLDLCPATGPAERSLGDLAACADMSLPASCDTELLTVRYHLPLIGACTLVVLGCTFDAPITASLPDALDVPVIATAPVTVTAPNLPPPL